MSLFGRQPAKERAYRCFFATDIHGSDRCFRKFLAAASAYEADALILGGDVAGKAIVPVERSPEGKVRYSFLGVDEERDIAELDAVCERIGFNGMYPWVANEAEIAEASNDKAMRESLFHDAISRQLGLWTDLAERRLDPATRIIITAGNDDPLFVDGTLDASERIESPEGDVVELGPVWIASLGNTPPTPWNTPREYSEDELREQIEQILGPYADGRPLVFNFHCPPADTGLDTAPELDSDFRPVVSHGTAVMIAAGSRAVREAVIEHSPVVGLFGHIHESHGAMQLADSWCINPGSDYSAGVLRGAIVDFDADGQHKAHLLTQG